MRVLVAYASRHGATQGIAERIAQTLSNEGLETVIKPASKARDVETFDAVVVGGAAYAFHWLKDATNFVRQNSETLASRPTWLFSSGPLGTDKTDPKTGKDVFETTVPKEFASFEQEIHPRAEKVFFGAWDPSYPRIGVMERLMAVMPAAKNALPAGDFRDWPEIDSWARGIARELKSAPVPA